MNINKVMFTGNLVADPALTQTKSGKSVVKVAIANNASYLTDSGERQKITTFVDITVWGKPAEGLANRAKKGMEICVEGELRLDTWEDDEGSKHSRHFIRADAWQFTQYLEKKS
jgi:single-strand DNA-binding protein